MIGLSQFDDIPKLSRLAQEFRGMFWSTVDQCLDKLGYGSLVEVAVHFLDKRKRLVEAVLLTFDYEGREVEAVSIVFGPFLD